MHDGGTELEVEVRLDALLGDRLGDSKDEGSVGRSVLAKRWSDAPLRVTTLELASEQVAEPALEQRDDSAKEEEPDPPAGGPEPDSGALADGTRVEARVDLGARTRSASGLVERAASG